MDNTQDNLRGRGVKGRFKRKPKKFRTVQSSDGSEKIVAVKSNAPILNNRGEISESVVTLPKISEPLQVQTKINDDGSETLQQVEQPIEQNFGVEESDNLKGKKRKTMKKLRPVKLGKKRVQKVAPIKTSKKKSVGEEALKFTKPLVKAMKIGLADKGLNVSTMSNVQVIEKFYNEFVSKKGDKNSTYEPLQEGFLTDHYLMSTDYDTFDSDSIVGTADVQMVANVGKAAIGKIKGFLAKRKAAKAAKKNPSQVMPKTEAKVSAETEKVMKQLEKEIKNEQPITKAENKSNIVKYVIFAVVAVLLIVVIIKFVKK